MDTYCRILGDRETVHSLEDHDYGSRPMNCIVCSLYHVGLAICKLWIRISVLLSYDQRSKELEKVKENRRITLRDLNHQIVELYTPKEFN